MNAGTSPCIVHFEGKVGRQRQLSDETLRTLTQKRREWLELPKHEKYNLCRDIAEKSFDFLPDGIKKVHELPESYSYHLTCYRSFTDITKLERAQKIAASISSAHSNSGATSTCDEYDGPKEKLKRTTRQSFDLRRGNETETTSSNVPPKCCLICKEYGPIYITDTVCHSEMLRNLFNTLT